jgi:hypothetical protein
MFIYSITELLIKRVVQKPNRPEKSFRKAITKIFKGIRSNFLKNKNFFKSYRIFYIKDANEFKLKLKLSYFTVPFSMAHVMFFCLFIFVVLGFKLMASCSLGKRSTT